MQSFFDLSGKVAIVTGASRGIGRGIAIGFAASGASVMLAARTGVELEEAVEACRASGGDADYCVTDITSRSSCENLVKRCVERFGRVDIAVSNAAAGIHGPASGMPQEDWDQVLAVGLTGYFNVARSAGEQMISQGDGGSILMVSANSSEVGYDQLTAVAAAKGGIDMMCRNLAVEWGHHGIRANSINPGFTEHVPDYGDVDPGTGEDLEDAVLSTTPLRKRATMDEMVGTAVFLSSPAAGSITGVSLRIDGGYAVK